MKTHHALLGLGGLIGIAAGAGCGSGTETTPPTDGGVQCSFIDGGGDPAVPPDGANACPQAACNYQTNAGCTAGQTCVPAPDGSGNPTPTCTGAGQGTNGAPCTSLAECAPGFLCTSATNGVCRKLCCGGDWSGCASEGEHCFTNLSLKDANGVPAPTGAMVCLPVNYCDALTPDSCSAPGETCQIVDATGATACLPDGTGDYGEPCPCKGGFLCVKDACRRLCKAVEGGEPCCPEGEGTCVHYTRDPEGVGECTPGFN